MAWLRTVSPRSVQSEVPFRPILVPPRRPTNYSEESASHCGGGMQSCGSTDSPHSCPSWMGSPDLLHSLYCLPPFWGNLFLSYSIIYIYIFQKKKRKYNYTVLMQNRSCFTGKQTCNGEYTKHCTRSGHQLKMAAPAEVSENALTFE